MYLERRAEQGLKEILAGDKVGMILGARQVGKTTLVEHGLAGRSAVFLNFDVDSPNGFNVVLSYGAVGVHALRFRLRPLLP